MALTVFAKPINNIATTVATGYTGGSLPGTPQSLVLTSGAGISLSAGQYIRVTIERSGTVITILKATSISTDTLTISSVLDGYTDATVNAGDNAELRVAAGTLSDIHTAINNLENNARAFDTATDASTTTIYLAASNKWHLLTTSGVGSNRILALDSPTTGQTFMLMIEQAASSGPYTVTWFSGILWAGGITPSLSTTASKTDVFVFTCVSAGVYLGSAVALGC